MNLDWVEPRTHARVTLGCPCCITGLKFSCKTFYDIFAIHFSIKDNNSTRPWGSKAVARCPFHTFVCLFVLTLLKTIFLCFNLILVYAVSDFYILWEGLEHITSPPLPHPAINRVHSIIITCCFASPAESHIVIWPPMPPARVRTHVGLDYRRGEKEENRHVFISWRLSAIRRTVTVMKCWGIDSANSGCNWSQGLCSSAGPTQ